ncbi:HEAT repeat domain-containing protein [Streptomyces sp. NPDC048208]|uniref:HEAT repeat domain-containing protein n=1 Tax=Streptomyces sp. NPDC048208 TaxID=3365515 RepID=UPI0037161D9D
MPGAEDHLVGAVRAGRAHRVRELLWAGADPETADTDGTPVLCLAVGAFDGYVAEALLDAGADPLRPLSDGTTPLLRAVASGNAGITGALLARAGERLAEEDREGLLACARRWSRTGAEAGLGRATGATGPAGRRRVVDRYHATEYDMITLGGKSVYDGHLAVLTCLEALFGVRRSSEELLARALARADGTHADWSETTAVLGDRLDDETWEAALSLRSDPDPLRRLFAADLVWHFVLLDGPPRAEGYLFERRALDVLLPWAVGETDPAVLVSVLNGLGELDDPRTEEVVLAHRAHPDPRVRSKVPGALRRTRTAFTHPEAWEVLAALARDLDARVRATVCEHLYAFQGRCRAASDILAGFLHEDDQMVRIKAVSGLADADDPRCVEGARLIGPVDRTEWPDTWLLDAVWRYERRRSG